MTYGTGQYSTGCKYVKSTGDDRCQESHFRLKMGDLGTGDLGTVRKNVKTRPRNLFTFSSSIQILYPQDSTFREKSPFFSYFYKYHEENWILCVGRAEGDRQKNLLIRWFFRFLRLKFMGYTRAFCFERQKKTLEKQKKILKKQKKILEKSGTVRKKVKTSGGFFAYLLFIEGWGF